MRDRGRRRGAPLRGVTVVSLAQNVPGPVALAQLVAAGATARKIEPPLGDPLRALNPAWYRALHRDVQVRRVDLKSVEGQARLHLWLDAADVLVTSQRPSALARLGITRRELARRHVHLRWVNIVGNTRDPERPGHDLTYLAEVGLLGREMPRTLLADLMGAERVVATVLLLLRGPGPAASVVGLQDTVQSAARPLALGLTTPRGPLGGGLPAYGIYETRSGIVAVAALEPHFRTRLFEALGLADGADLTAVMRTRTARQWERWASARDLPMARVR